MSSDILETRNQQGLFNVDPCAELGSRRMGFRLGFSWRAAHWFLLLGSLLPASHPISVLLQLALPGPLSSELSSLQRGLGITGCFSLLPHTQAQLAAFLIAVTPDPGEVNQTGYPKKLSHLVH